MGRKGALLYKRILIKISGEVLMGGEGFGHDIKQIKSICSEIKKVQELGMQVCLVVGGGNIYRGISASGMERSTADYIGMLATVMNALALQNVLEDMSVPTRVLSAIPMTTIAEPYIRRRAVRHLEKGRIIIFAAGTGNPFFTTDTAAALRASEMSCDVLLKGTKVDGVYDMDPNKFQHAEKYDQLSYSEVVSRDLQVMDTAAVSLCKENSIPILVFSIRESNSLINVVQGMGDYTIIE